MKTQLLDGIRKQASLKEFYKSEGIRKILTAPPVLWGSGIGAVAGGTAGALIDKDKRWRGGLIGAGAGTLVGGGVGAAVLSSKIKAAVDRIGSLNREAKRLSSLPGGEEALKIRNSSPKWFSSELDKLKRALTQKEAIRNLSFRNEGIRRKAIEASPKYLRKFMGSI